MNGRGNLLGDIRYLIIKCFEGTLEDLLLGANTNNYNNYDIIIMSRENIVMQFLKSLITKHITFAERLFT